MRECDIYWKENVVGKAAIYKDGLYYRIDCICDLPKNKIFRVYAVTNKETVNLGVCLPDGEVLQTNAKISISRMGESPPRFYVTQTNENIYDFFELLPDQPVDCVSCLRQCVFTVEDGRVRLIKKQN